MNNAKLYLHLWLKKPETGNTEATYFVHRSHVSLTADLPELWSGQTYSNVDKFDVQQIEWPPGVEEIVK